MFDAWNRALKAKVHWDSLEEWDGEGDGEEIRMGGHIRGWFTSMYGKNHHDIVVSLN